MRLDWDVCRCNGQEDDYICPQRDTCARYLELNNMGPRSAYCQLMREVNEDCPFYIEDKRNG